MDPRIVQQAIHNVISKAADIVVPTAKAQGLDTQYQPFNRNQDFSSGPPVIFNDYSPEDKAYIQQRFPAPDPHVGGPVGPAVQFGSGGYAPVDNPPPSDPPVQWYDQLFKTIQNANPFNPPTVNAQEATPSGQTYTPFNRNQALSGVGPPVIMSDYSPEDKAWIQQNFPSYNPPPGPPVGPQVMWDSGGQYDNGVTTSVGPKVQWYEDLLQMLQNANPFKG